MDAPLEAFYKNIRGVVVLENMLAKSFCKSEEKHFVPSVALGRQKTKNCVCSVPIGMYRDFSFFWIL